MLKLYENIKNLRSKLGLSQEELAYKTGYTDRSSIAKIESGKVDLTQSKIAAFAQAFNVSPAYLMGWEDDSDLQDSILQSNRKGVQIPVLGYVRAGYPIYAEENIIDYEEISNIMAAKGEFFGLRIQGNSMEPRMFENDVVIVRKQPDIESGEIAVVLVNGDEATVKKVIKSENGIMLVPLNSNCSYEPHFYTNEEIESCPVIIAGKVVEVRGKL